MKKLTMGLAVVATMALSTTAWAQAINTTCPVKAGKAVKSTITTTFEGKTIAFC